MNGYIFLHRSLLDWDWYSDGNTKDVFIHLLLKANFKPGNWKGITIARGQLVTSLPSLSAELGISIQSIRTAIKHLKSTGEVTDVSTGNARLVTVVNYDKYQSLDDELTDVSTGILTSDQQAANRQLTGNQQQRNKVIKKDCEEGKTEEESTKRKRFTPPAIDEVSSYCKERNNSVDPERFIDFYASKGWKVGNQPMKDWKAAVRTWEKRDNGANTDPEIKPRFVG